MDSPPTPQLSEYSDSEVSYWSDSDASYHSELLCYSTSNSSSSHTTPVSPPSNSTYANAQIVDDIIISDSIFPIHSPEQVTTFVRRPPPRVLTVVEKENIHPNRMIPTNTPITVESLPPRLTPISPFRRRLSPHTANTSQNSELLLTPTSPLRSPSRTKPLQDANLNDSTHSTMDIYTPKRISQNHSIRKHLKIFDKMKNTGLEFSTDF